MSIFENFEHITFNLTSSISLCPLRRCTCCIQCCSDVVVIYCYFLFLIIRSEDTLPHLLPIVLALAVAGFVVHMPQKFAPQTRNVFFVVAFVFSNAYLARESGNVAAVWASFKSLGDAEKFAISLCVISVTYFATAMCFDESKEEPASHCSNLVQPPPSPVKSPSKKSAMSFFSGPTGFLTDSPALSDFAVDFEVPDELPESDRDLFEFMFEK